MEKIGFKSVGEGGARVERTRNLTRALISSSIYNLTFFFSPMISPIHSPSRPLSFSLSGCSSSTGLLFELGPCTIQKDGLGTTNNPYSWNNKANMIFLDQPVAVGYSYTEGEQVSDTPQAAEDVYAFLQLFFKKFPEYSTQEFSVAAESYGGR